MFRNLFTENKVSFDNNIIEMNCFCQKCFSFFLKVFIIIDSCLMVNYIKIYIKINLIIH